MRNPRITALCLVVAVCLVVFGYCVGVELVDGVERHMDATASEMMGG